MKLNAYQETLAQIIKDHIGRTAMCIFYPESWWAVLDITGSTASLVWDDVLGASSTLTEALRAAVRTVWDRERTISPLNNTLVLKAFIERLEELGLAFDLSTFCQMTTLESGGPTIWSQPHNGARFRVSYGADCNLEVYYANEDSPFWRSCNPDDAVMTKGVVEVLRKLGRHGWKPNWGQSIT